MGDTSDNSPNDVASSEEWNPVVSTLVKWLVGTFLITLCSFAPKWYEEAQRQREWERQQKQIEKDVRNAVRKGEAGEAFNRLYAEEREQYLREQRGQKKTDDQRGW